MTVNPFNLFVQEEILRCVAVSDPSTPPRVTWHRLVNGTATLQLNSGGTGGRGRLVVKDDGSLIFRGFAEDEWQTLMGWYRCVADNGYTSDAADVFLDVLTSPPVRTRSRILQNIFLFSIFLSLRHYVF